MSTQADDFSVPVGARAGEYEIRDILGRGGMGTVYAGIHPVIGKEVAIKVLDPRLATTAAVVERFELEARAVNTIQHPNIIDIFAFGHSPQLGYYFVMPRLRGENLGDRIARAPMSLTEALPIVTEIVDALAAAHAAGIAHRDLKPDNIFLETTHKGGVTVQLLDFGIAKLLDADPAIITRSGTQMGTPLFMAPEQWDGAGIDHRADIYALGIIVHHMLTGRYPFESQSPLALMNMHGNAAPQLPGACGGPAVVDPVIARALAKDKLLRYQSAPELLVDLRAAAAMPDAVRAVVTSPRGAPAVGSISTLEAFAAARPRRRFAVIVIVVGVSAAAAVTAFVMTREHAAPAAGAGSIDAAGVGSATAVGAILDAALPQADAAAIATPVAVDAGGVRAIDARPRRVEHPNTVTPDAAVRTITPDARVAPPPRDASAPRPPRDSSWGSTVDPFAEDHP